MLVHVSVGLSIYLIAFKWKSAEKDYYQKKTASVNDKFYSNNEEKVFKTKFKTTKLEEIEIDYLQSANLTRINLYLNNKSSVFYFKSSFL